MKKKDFKYVVFGLTFVILSIFMYGLITAISIDNTQPTINTNNVNTPSIQSILTVPTKSELITVYANTNVVDYNTCKQYYNYKYDWCAIGSYNVNTNKLSCMCWNY